MFKSTTGWVIFNIVIVMIVMIIMIIMIVIVVIIARHTSCNSTV